MKRIFSFPLIVFALIMALGLVGCNGLWDFDDDDDVSVTPVNFKFVGKVDMTSSTNTNNIRAAAINPVDYTADVYYEGDSTTKLNGSAIAVAADGTFTADFSAFDGRSFYLVFSKAGSTFKLYRYFNKKKAEMDSYTSTNPAIVNQATTAVGILLQANPTKKYGTDYSETTTNADVTNIATAIDTFVKDTTGADFAIPVTGVVINQTGPVSIQFGKTTTLTATVSPTYATNLNVTWASDNTAIATVDANTGVVTANSTTEGTANITVTTSGKDSTGAAKTATIEIKVNKGPVLVEKLELDKTTSTIAVGGTVDLAVVITPASPDNATLKWESSNSSVAKVESTGATTAKVTGLAVGTNVVITVSSTDGSNKSATFTVSVTTAPTTTTVTLSEKYTASTQTTEALTTTITGASTMSFRVENANGGLDTAVTFELETNDTTLPKLSFKATTDSTATLVKFEPTSSSPVTFKAFNSITFTKVLPTGTKLSIADGAAGVIYRGLVP